MAFCAEALVLWESLYGWRNQGQWHENGLSRDGLVRRSGVLSGPPLFLRYVPLRLALDMTSWGDRDASTCHPDLKILFYPRFCWEHS